ncbi:MAG: PAS domain S-box protein [Planctomycetota bacterium]
MRKIADNNLDFRFKVTRNDEIGLLEGSFNDMASRLQVHQGELKSTMEYLKGIVENAADLIITVNQEGRIQTFNRGAEQSLGYCREEVIGKRIEMLFADHQDRNKAIQMLQHSDHVTNYETRFFAKNGNVRNVLLTLSILRDAKEKPIGTFGISKDITREKSLQEKLIQSEKFVAIGQAVTGIQHAIKNMLNALKGGAYLLNSGIAKNNRDRLEEGWQMVEEGITRISNLSLNMLNYAKEWKLELEEVDLTSLIQKINRVFGETANKEGVAFRSDFSGPQLPVICDPSLIHMAVMDIVSNALDACTLKDYPEGEDAEITISVYLQRDVEASVIEISDNGIGMNQEIMKNLFTPFFSTKKQWGTGLGLALTSKIINMHGGEILFDSKPDLGAVFRIVLPVNGPCHNKEIIDGEENTCSR